MLPAVNDDDKKQSYSLFIIFKYFTDCLFSQFGLYGIDLPIALPLYTPASRLHSPSRGSPAASGVTVEQPVEQLQPLSLSSLAKKSFLVGRRGTWSLLVPF